MARRMNYDAAKRREWKAEARHQRAMEISNDQWIRIKKEEEKWARPASVAQIRLVEKYQMHKYCGHEDSYLKTMTNRAAHCIIQKYSAEVWNSKPKKKPQQNFSKNKKPKYKPLKTVFETQGKPEMNGGNIIRSKGPEKK